MKKRLIALSVLAVLLFGGTFGATAITFPPPVPFEIWSPDDSRVFRFVPSEEHRGMADAAVYLIGDLEERLYTVTGLTSFAYASNFIFSDDLRHFVFQPNIDQIVALEFFADGNLIKTYDIYDLVLDNRARRELSLTWHKWRDWGYGIHFSPQDNTVSLRTVDGIRYTFDITTGEITATQSLQTWHIILLFASGAGIVVVLIYLAVRRKGRGV